MGKSLVLAEKPSVGRELARVLGCKRGGEGYLEGDRYIVTWALGHLVTLADPESYDKKLSKWDMEDLPMLPEKMKLTVIKGSGRQFHTVQSLMSRADVSELIIATDAGREGEYIYRLVEQMAHIGGKERRRVWIDSQTEDEILRGIHEAKDLSAYDSLSDSAYLRAKEDYLMGINFSRALTLKFQNPIKDFLRTDKATVSVGRVMTCVLGIVVDREREIRDFVKTPFYRILAGFDIGGFKFDAEWRSTEGSKFYGSPALYKENGFKDRSIAEAFVKELKDRAAVDSITNKKETKNPPLLFNLAELQNECSKRFKISPDETLAVVQELYEKKMVTYPRTDARVLSSAIAKVKIGRASCRERV